MTADIRLTNDAVIVDGRLETGRVTAERVTADRLDTDRVDADGAITGKTLTAGTGSFSLVVVDGTVQALKLEGDSTTTRLASFDDVRTRIVTAETLLNARLSNVRAERLLGAAATGAVTCKAEALALVHPAAPEVVTGPVTELAPGRGTEDASGPGPGPGPMPEPTTPIPPRLALSHEFGPGKDRLVLNRLGRYTQGVHVEGNLTASGAISQASSIAVKRDVRALSTADALAALAGLSPVTYRYTDDAEQVQHVGFVAEDVPDLVAAPGRDRLSPMDIVAVLTAAVRDQQERLARLTTELADLRAAADPARSG